MVQQKINQGCGKKDKAWNRVQKVAHRIQIAQPLSKLQTWRKQRVVGAQNLNHPSGPANALANVCR